MRRLFYLFIIFFLFFILSSTKIYADSSYVLPYPSTMPGGLVYKLRLAYDAISKYWYFGNFGQFSYDLKMSDKYLVEAKTLFEYKQYLLGYKALKKSDLHFVRVNQSLKKANSERKDISGKRSILEEAALRHIEVLEEMDIRTPDSFIWQPEKSLSTNLYLKKDIENAISVRKNNL